MTVPNVDVTRDEMLARIIEEMHARRTADGRLDPTEWRSRYPDLADEALRLFDTDRVLFTAASNWKAAGALETSTDAPDATNTGSKTLPDGAIERVEQVGRYRILRPLGQGGMGTVYEAEDPDLRRRVALKMPHFIGSTAQRENARQRFFRESRAAATVEHPNVCPIYDVGEENGRPFVVMAYVEGESLAERLTRERFDDRAAAVLVQRVAEALAIVHGHGIIHRDLKPGNILMRAKDGQPVLTDFGLARVENDHEHRTADGALMGTAAYMAPEQARSDLGPVTAKSDTYSLGVVLFELLTGRRPFEGNILQLVHQVATESAPSVLRYRPDLDPALNMIVERALAREPQVRFPDAATFAQALAGWLARREPGAPAPVKAGAVAPVEPVRAEPRRQFTTRLAVAVGVLLAAVALAVVIVLKPGNDSDATVNIELADATNATVFIDGKEQPALRDEPVVRLKLKPGKHVLSVRRAGREVAAKEFEVKPDEVIEWSVKPQPKPPQVPGPARMDVLDPKKIPTEERFPWQPTELVAVYGSHAWQGWGDPFWHKTGNGVQLLAAAHVGDDFLIRDPQTGREVAKFTRKNAVNSYLSPDGAVAGLFSHTANGGGWTWELWDIEKQNRLLLLSREHVHGSPYPVAVALSPDKIFAVAMTQLDTVIWEVATGKEVAKIPTELQTSSFAAPTFSPDGKMVAWTRRDGADAPDIRSEAVVFDLVGRKELKRRQTPKGHAYHGVQSISPDGKTVVFASHIIEGNNPGSTWALNFWDWTNDKLNPKSNGSYLSVLFSPDWKQFIVNQSNELVDVATGTKTSIPAAGDRYAFSPDGTKLAMKARHSGPRQPEGPIVVWDLVNKKYARGTPSQVRCLALAPDNKTLALTDSSEPNLLKLVDVTGGKPIPIRVEGLTGFGYAAFSPDGTLVAANGYDALKMHVCRVKDGDLVTVLTGGGFRQPYFSPDGKTLVAGVNGVRFWETEKWTERCRTKDTVQGTPGTFSADSRRVALETANGTKWFDTQTGAEVGDLLKGVSLNWAHPMFVADGKRLVSNGVIYDVASGKELCRTSSLAECNTVASPDGRSFFVNDNAHVTNGWRGIRQFSASDGKLLNEWRLPFSVERLFISADGRYLISSNGNGTVYILRLGQPK